MSGSHFSHLWPQAIYKLRLSSRPTNYVRVWLRVVEIGAALLSRRLKLHNGVIAVAIVACVGLFSTYGAQTWHARSVDLRQARRETNNLAESLSLQVASTFQTADAALLDMRAAAEHGSIDSDELRQRMDALAPARVDGVPVVYALTVLNRNGKTIASTQSSAPKANFADREYFRFHRTHVSRQLHVGAPVRSKIDRAWIITATRRFNCDGLFCGVVEVKMSLRFFEHIYDGVDVGKNGVISLIRGDGTVLVHKPFIESLLGRTINKGTLYPLLRRSSAGSVTVRSVLDGITRLSAFRWVDGYPLVSVVALSENDILTEWRSEAILNLGLISFLVAVVGVVASHLASQIKQRQDAQEKLARLASVDGLTGLANRRYFDVALDKAWRRALREGSQLAVLMIDADHFKAYNDRYGHLQGDEALIAIGRHIMDGACRPDDLGARYGGEEFAVILPLTDTVGANVTAERIRSTIASTRLQDIAANEPSITVSIGLASMRPRALGLQNGLLAAADAALYAAKRAGRNRTEAYNLPHDVSS